MRIIRLSKLSKLAGLLILVIHSGFLSAQEDATVVDSILNVKKTIALSDISIKSGEAIVNTKRLAESLISDEELEQLIRETDSILAGIDTIVKNERNSDYSKMGFRFLNFKLVFWNDFLSEIEDVKSTLTSIIKELDKTKYDLKDEIAIWERTKKLFKDDESAESVITRINKLNFLMDSVAQLAIAKSSSAISTLDKTTEYNIRIEDIISGIDKAIISKTEGIFERDQYSSLLNFSAEKSRLNFRMYLKDFYGIESDQFKRFIKNQLTGVYFEILILLILIVLFILIRNRLRSVPLQDTFYKKMLVQIFQRPISSAVLMALFISLLIFENRPPILKDLSFIVAGISIMFILSPILDKNYMKYIYLFGTLILLRQFTFVFPENHTVYKLIFLLIAILEILGLVLLFVSLYKFPAKRKLLDKLLILVVVIHLGLAIIGFISVLTNYMSLAEITINFTVYNIFAGLLIITSALIINGLTQFAIDSNSWRRINSIRINGEFLKKRVPELVNFGALLLWLNFLLKALNVQRSFFLWITSVTSREMTIGSANFKLTDIFTFIFLIWLSIFISKIIRIILEEDILSNLKLAKGVPRTISVMIKYTLVTFGFVLAVSVAGLPLTSLTILFSAFGVGIGFGLQNIFNNLVSGLILLFERPIQLGDTIEVGTLIGKVNTMGIRSSHLRTFDGAEVIVPNGNLISNEVVNWTLSDQQRRIEVLAGVAYGSDPHLVQKLFKEILCNHPEVIQDPSPSVFFQNMGESSLDFRLLFWTSNYAEWVRIRSEIVFQVHDILVENNIEIPFPQRDLHLRSVDKNIGFFNQSNINNP